jgi:hypothetical protein
MGGGHGVLSLVQRQGHPRVKISKCEVELGVKREPARRAWDAFPQLWFVEEDEGWAQLAQG